MKLRFIALGLFFVLLSHAQDPNSKVAITLKDKDFLPENVAYDPVDKAYYVGSTRYGKIVKVDKNKRESDFTKSQQEGMWQVIGMKVDPKNRCLWVCSSAGENLKGYKLNTNDRPAGIFKYDLTTGKLIKKYLMDNSGEVHFFNDIVVSDNGDVYITHTFKEHAIYTISKKRDELEVFVKLDTYRYPNGITLSVDNAYLFFPYSGGIGRVRIADKKIDKLSLPEGLNLSREGSLDGLYFYKNSLIGVQSSLKTILKFQLSSDLLSVLSTSVMETKHPKMAYPTTGIIHGDTFFYVANSHFDLVNDDGTIPDESKLTSPVIIALPISRF